MEKTVIKLTIEKDQVQTETTSPIQLDQLVQIFATVTLAGMQDLVKRTPTEHQQATKEYLYDQYNHMASRLLELFAPEIELRPDLTSAAILKAENEIIEEQYKAYAEQHPTNEHESNEAI